MDEVLASVVVPYFNVTRFLGDTLESLAQQTFNKFQVILIDDGSNSTHTDFADLFRGKLDILELRTEHRGVSAARNFAARRAVGRYIAFLDADDCWLPLKLKTQIEQMEADSSAFLCYGNAAYITTDGSPMGKLHNRQLGLERLPEGDVLPDVLSQSFVLPSTLMMRRSDYLDLGGFDEKLAIAEDWEFSLRAALRGPFLATQEPLVLYRRHPGSVGLYSEKALDDKRTVIERMASHVEPTLRNRYRRSHLARAFLNEGVASLHTRRWTRGIKWILRAFSTSPRATWSGIRVSSKARAAGDSTRAVEQS